MCGTFRGFFEPIAFAFDSDDLGAVDQPVDESDHGVSGGLKARLFGEVIEERASLWRRSLPL